MFDRYLTLWDLVPEGELIITAGSRLLPVRYKDVSAMLKIAFAEEEQRGAATLVWWKGEGAVSVLAHEGNAILMERATGKKSLIEMVHKGQDDEASQILCSTAAKLHANKNSQPIELISLELWFKDLNEAALQYGGILSKGAKIASELLRSQQDIVVLHGDLHHGNVLDFRLAGWLAIDPKGLIGERGFDFANIFCNPDLCDPTVEIATLPGRLVRQVSVVATAANLERVRLLKWILSYACLSAAWTLGYGGNADLALRVARLADGELLKI